MSRPPRTSSSSAASILAESDWSPSITGTSTSGEIQSSPSTESEPGTSCPSRARIRLTLPSIVLISPLWHSIRNGWARSQLGAVLVENREWKIASAEVNRSSRRSA
jgi:hypothetical protein